VSHHPAVWIVGALVIVIVFAAICAIYMVYLWDNVVEPWLFDTRMRLREWSRRVANEFRARRLYGRHYARRAH